jgi:hypothetical protein
VHEDMADVVLAVSVYEIGQLALFALAVIANVRWKVSIADLTSLLRACVRYPIVRPVARAPDKASKSSPGG